MTAVTLEHTGWVVVPNVIEPALVERLAEDLYYAWSVCNEVQERNGIAADMSRTVHHLLAIQECSSFRDLLSAYEALDPILTRYFRGKYILNSLGGAINTKDVGTYAHQIHRDIRAHQSEPFVLNTLVMLDDFTPENGATWLGPRTPTKPGSEAFYTYGTQALGTAGSVLIFDSNIWHAGGENYTDKPRRSLTPMFCKPYIKPQFDYCRALGERGDLSPYQRQLIGYNARIPATLDEWYRKPEERFYQGDQG